MSKDLRYYAKQTQTRLVFGFIMLVFVVGGGLIFLFYGREAGFLALVCIAGALVPVLLIAIFLWIADRAVKKLD